jgi:hypothetical protein
LNGSKASRVVGTINYAEELPGVVLSIGDFVADGVIKQF